MAWADISTYLFAPGNSSQLTVFYLFWGMTYAQLAEKLAAMGIHETERNLNNKISRGGFSGAFLIQCLEAIGAKAVNLES